MVKTRSHNEEEADKAEKTESNEILKQILSELTSMKSDIEELKAKSSPDKEKTKPLDTVEKTAQIKNPKTPFAESQEQQERHTTRLTNSPSTANLSTFFTAFSDETPKNRSIQNLESSTNNNGLTIIRGETAHYKSQLRTVTDLYEVISHLTNFNDWRRRLSSQQLLITTMHRNALTELDLGLLAGSDNMQDSQILRFIKVYWHATPPTRTEFFKMIEKIQLDDTDLQMKNNDNQAIIQNYRIMSTYLADINRFALSFKELTGMEYQDNIINKRNVSAEYPYSTIWQIAESKLSVVAPSWLEIITYEMNFKEFKTWKTVYKKIQEKSEEVMLIYRQHATIFNGIKGMLRPPRSPQVHKQPDRNQSYSPSQSVINKTSPPPTRKLFPKLASIQDSPAIKPITHDYAAEQEESSNSDDDYNRDRISTNIQVEDNSQTETDDQNEEGLAELYALGNDKTDERVCYKWLTGQCNLGKDCILPHSTTAAEKHIQKLKLALDKKRIPNLASIGNGVEGMRTTAWLDLEDGQKPHKIQVLLDPGSDVHSFISRELVKELFMDTSHKEEAATIRLGGTEHTQQTEGAIWINITIEQVTATILMHIFDTKEDVIIGLPHIRQHFIQPTVNLLVQNRQTPLNFVTALDPIASMAALSHEDIEAELVRLMEQQEK